jgi:hypothetical protein
MSMDRVGGARSFRLDRLARQSGPVTCGPATFPPAGEGAFDQEEHEGEPVAERAGSEDRGVHVGAFEQLLRLEHAVPRPSIAAMLRRRKIRTAARALFSSKGRSSLPRK